ITCFLIYYVISKTSVKISPEVSGWQRASSEDELKYNTSLCTIEKRNAESLDFEEFEKIYRYKKPLIVQFNGDTQTSFKKYLEIMHEKKHNEEPMYVFDRRFYNDSELPQSVRVPSYFRIKDGVDSSIFFLGGSGSGVSFHKHADAWNGVIFGRKRWFLYPPQKTPPGGVWPSFSQLDWINKVYPNPSPKDKPVECIQEEGDILYLPESYYHGTVNIGDTMAIGIQKYNAATKIEKLFYKSVKGGDQLKIFQELSALLPDNTEMLHKLADQYFQRGDIQKAIKVSASAPRGNNCFSIIQPVGKKYQDKINLSSKTRFSRHCFGFQSRRFSLKNHEIFNTYSRSLLQALETAVRVDPLFVIARLDLSRYYDHHGNQETAEKLFKEALEVHPDSFDGHIHYGEFLYSKGDYVNAASEYKQITRLRPDKKFGYYQLAKCVDRIGDKQGAKAARLKLQEIE
ncbi:unnamed protein product, partial [Porites lobata]